jgi:hypothetical protein
MLLIHFIVFLKNISIVESLSKKGKKNSLLIKILNTSAKGQRKKCLKKNRIWMIRLNPQKIHLGRINLT